MSTKKQVAVLPSATTDGIESLTDGAAAMTRATVSGTLTRVGVSSIEQQWQKVSLCSPLYCLNCVAAVDIARGGA